MSGFRFQLARVHVREALLIKPVMFYVVMLFISYGYAWRFVDFFIDHVLLEIIQIFDVDLFTVNSNVILLYEWRHVIGKYDER